MATQTRVVGGESARALKGVAEARKAGIQRAVLAWAYDRPLRYPWRQSGRTPYEVLVGELSLRDTAPLVAINLYHSLIRRFLSIQALARAPEDDLAEILSSFCLQQYARQIKTLAESLLQCGGGNMPRDSQAFVKTIRLEHSSVSIIMCFGYGLPVSVTDHNVSRLLSRLFAGNLPREPEQGLLQALGQALLPDRDYQCYNCGLLDLAELVCRHEEPLCIQCPLKDICDSAVVPVA